MRLFLSAMFPAKMVFRGCAVMFLWTGALFAQHKPSLAEQAAAARRAAPASNAALGRVVADRYINSLLGFEIQRLPGWTSLNRGEINVTEALGREAMRMRAGVDSARSGIVFMMHDGGGSSMNVSVRQVPPGEHP